MGMSLLRLIGYWLETRLFECMVMLQNVPRVLVDFDQRGEIATHQGKRIYIWWAKAWENPPCSKWLEGHWIKVWGAEEVCSFVTRGAVMVYDRGWGLYCKWANLSNEWFVSRGRNSLLHLGNIITQLFSHKIVLVLWCLLSPYRKHRAPKKLGACSAQCR